MAERKKMRLKFIGMTLALGAVFGFLGLYGCGDTEPLGIIGDRYTANLIFLDGGSEDATISIDVWRDTDCDDDLVFDDWEDYGPVYALLTLTIDSEVNGLTLVDYDIDYIPLTTPLVGGGTITPIALEDNVDRGLGTDYFPAGAETQLTFTFMTTQTKEQYRAWWVANYPADIDQGRYTFRLTCYFEDDFGVEKEMVFERTVFLFDVDNC